MGVSQRFSNGDQDGDVGKFMPRLRFRNGYMSHDLSHIVCTDSRGSFYDIALVEGSRRARTSVSTFNRPVYNDCDTETRILCYSLWSSE
jgi:hypothetical protein